MESLRQRNRKINGLAAASIPQQHRALVRDKSSRLGRPIQDKSQIAPAPMSNMLMIVVVMLVGGQLQYRSGLPSNELRNLQNLAVGEFQRVMLNVQVILINLPEARDLVIQSSLARKLQAKKTDGAFVLNVLVEGEFRSGSRQTATSGGLS